MNRARTFELLEGGFRGGDGPRLVAIFIVTLIIFNVVAVVAESHGDNHTRFNSFFVWFEVISVGIFTVEYILRLWSAPEAVSDLKISERKARLRYALSVPALIDLLAVFPAYLSFFVGIDLRVLRMFRLFRLLKLTHYFPGLNLLFFVLRQEAATLISAALAILILILVSSSLMYAAEQSVQPEAFGSISSAFWWATVTMTTVGYGDVTPVTPIGRILATLIMLLGVGIVALPAGLLAARFAEELRSRKDELDYEIDMALRDGAICEDEKEELEKVRAHLGISKERFDRILRLRSVRHRAVPMCPNCGKKID